MRLEIYARLKSLLDADRLAALATVVAGPGRGRQLLITPRDDRDGWHLLLREDASRLRRAALGDVFRA